MTRRALLALLVLALAALACSVQPDTSGVITMVIVTDTPTPSPTATTAGVIEQSGVRVWGLTPIATATP